MLMYVYVCAGERRARTEPFCPHLKLNADNVTALHGYQSDKPHFLPFIPTMKDKRRSKLRDKES